MVVLSWFMKVLLGICNNNFIGTQRLLLPGLALENRYLIDILVSRSEGNILPFVGYVCYYAFNVKYPRIIAQ